MEEKGKTLDHAKVVVTEQMEAARERFQEVAKGVGEKAKKVSGEVRKEAQRASTVAKEKYGVAKEQLKTGYTRVKKDMDALSADVNDYVRDNPGKSVAIAAGLGFILGLLFRGHSRRD